MKRRNFLKTLIAVPAAVKAVPAPTHTPALPAAPASAEQLREQVRYFESAYPASQTCVSFYCIENPVLRLYTAEDMRLIREREEEDMKKSGGKSGKKKGY